MAAITIRVDDETKQKADILFDELGISMSSAINVFLKQAVRYGGIPFEIRAYPSQSSDNQAHDD